MSIDKVREAVVTLNRSAAALAALGAAIDARCAGGALDPSMEQPVGDVLAALGLRGALDDIAPSELRPLLGEIRSLWAIQGKWLTGAGRRPGWSHSDPDLLQEMGLITTPFARAFQKMLAPKLAGLVPRLEAPGAAFLDIGVGVGALALEMVRLWPNLRAVGVDVWAPSLALARENVARAGLGDRIELREQGGQDIPDVDAFDVAWMASSFMPEAVVPETCRRVLRALRPGGWLLFATAKPGDELTTAVARVRTASFGGTFVAPAELEARLVAHGFVEVATLPGPPTAVAAVVAARRAP